MHQIGEVADALGLSIRTIRHWDEMGLVPPSGRSVGGFRLYTDDDIELMRLVKNMKPLGFTLDEMRDVLVALDELGSAEISPEQRAALLDRLGKFADEAESSCAQLRAQLVAAESLAATLQALAGRRTR